MPGRTQNSAKPRAKFREAKEWLEATEAWQAIRAISKAARQYLTDMKKSAAVAFRQS
jgi:hypothetical protein